MTPTSRRDHFDGYYRNPNSADSECLPSTGGGPLLGGPRGVGGAAVGFVLECGDSVSLAGGAVGFDLVQHWLRTR